MFDHIAVFRAAIGGLGIGGGCFVGPTQFASAGPDHPPVDRVISGFQEGIGPADGRVQNPSVTGEGIEDLQSVETPAAGGFIDQSVANVAARRRRQLADLVDERFVFIRRHFSVQPFQNHILGAGNREDHQERRADHQFGKDTSHRLLPTKRRNFQNPELFSARNNSNRTWVMVCFPKLRESAPRSPDVGRRPHQKCTTSGNGTLLLYYLSR